MSAMFRAAGSALLRAAVRTEDERLSPPVLSGDAAALVQWLRQVWTTSGLAEAIEHSSPDLGRAVLALLSAAQPETRGLRGTALAVHRYVQRAGGRATPFGLLAGVAPVSFGTATHVRWGADHHVRASTSAAWLDEVTEQLLTVPALAARLPVVVNNVVQVRDNKLIVPAVPQRNPRRIVDAEVQVHLSRPVRLVLELAPSPIRLDDLAAQIGRACPGSAPEPIARFLRGLVVNRVLLANLVAPSTCTDPLAHLLAQLDVADASAVPGIADLVSALHDIHEQLATHNKMPGYNTRERREALVSTMRSVRPTTQHPLALDLRLDAAATLPATVVGEVERAATILLRLSAHPNGMSAWSSYHMRFYERYGRGALVPVLQVVDTDSGIGWPDGYPGAATGLPLRPMAARDTALLGLAQSAALTGQYEVVLDDAMLAALAVGPDLPRVPGHVELAVAVHSASVVALQRGRFQVQVQTVARSAGPMVGRFLDILRADDAAQLADDLAAMPCGDSGTVTAQLSFPPVSPADAHVARAPKVHPLMISISEHRDPEPGLLTVEDLAIGCDGRRMYLAAPSLGKRIEAVVMHGLNPVQHTPPLARLLIELTRAQYAQTTAFDWGAASTLPFRPRLRVGRVVLSPATWRINAADLPSPSVPQSDWDTACKAWQGRHHLPTRVLLSHGDQRLPLDLADDSHRVLLRDQLNKHRQATLVEAPPTDANGWLGGHVHELVVPVAATILPPWPKLPTPTPQRVIGRGHGLTPATSRLLLAELYGDQAGQDRILARHLPELLDKLGQRWPGGMPWWFVRFRNPDQHLRLRLDLPAPAEFGPAAGIVSGWADRLHRAGLVRELRYATSYPETGRWGDGPALAAAEDIFRADSAAVLTQLRQARTPGRMALLAAVTVSIAIAFCGNTNDGMAWLIDNIPAASRSAVDRAVFTDATRLADPDHDWATLRAQPGGPAIMDAWRPRDHALAAYRSHLPGPHTVGVDADDVLGSLLHLAHARAYRIDFADEAIVFSLARAAAKRWMACRRGSS